MGMGFAPTWLRRVSPPLLHKTTLTTAGRRNQRSVHHGFIYNLLIQEFMASVQCFDTVGWVTGGHPVHGLNKSRTNKIAKGCSLGDLRGKLE